MASKSRIHIERVDGQWDSIMLVTGSDSIGDRVRKIPDLLARIPYKGVLLIGAALSAIMSVVVFLLFEDWRIAVLTWVAVMLTVTFLETSGQRRSHSHKRKRLDGSTKVGSVLSRYDFPERGTVGLMMTSRILDSYERIVNHPAIDSLVEVDEYALNKSVWEAATKGHRIAVSESQRENPMRVHGINASTLEEVSDPESQDLRDLGTFASHMAAALESLDRAQLAYDIHLGASNARVEIRIIEPIDNGTLWSVIQRSEAIVLMNGGVPKRTDRG